MGQHKGGTSIVRDFLSPSLATQLIPTNALLMREILKFVIFYDNL